MERGDFLGFTFGNYSSDDLEIIRVSSSDRYEEQLQPEIKDRTAEVPGLNGEYYFGSDYGTRSFDIEFAFDHLTEQQFRKLRKVFGTKRIQKLIFDERPYKYYMAKLESPVELSYVCFDEPKKVKFSEKYNVGTIDTEAGAQSGEVLTELPDGVRIVDDGEGNRVREKVDPWVYEEGTERIYKGEGKMTLICYYPFAKSNFKVLPAEGSEEWAISSGILSAEVREANGIDVYSAGAIKIYNPGDVETGFRLYIPAAALGNQITLQYEGAQLIIDPIELKKYAENAYDKGVIVDTNTGLITGVISLTIDSNGNPVYTTSGNIYNQFVDSGYFFKFEPTDFTTYDDLPVLQITGASEGVQIFYDYLYF